MEKMETVTSTGQEAFFSLFQNRLRFQLYLFSRLPAAFFSGLRVEKMDSEHCVVSVPYKWFTRNPFRSTYFACLAMAAEMSTGMLAMSHVYQRKPAISMLVTGMEASYYKKAKGRIRFICTEGKLIEEAIHRAIALNQPQVVKAVSKGYNQVGELTTECTITWSFKVK